MLRDLRHAGRMLLRSKGWTAVVLLSLAVGIGVNTTLFSALNALLVKTLPVFEPERLVRLRWVGENQMRRRSSDYGYSAPNAAGQPARATFSFAVFEALRSANRTLTDLLACAPIGRVNVVVNGQAELADAFLSSGNYFDVLGVGAAIGRTIGPEDDRPAAPAVAMISHGYWERRFGKDPGVLGRQITVNQTPVTIVGVTESGYAGVQGMESSAPDIHFPLFLDERINQSTRLKEGTSWWLQILGRLKPGVTPEQVVGNLDGVFRGAARAGWNSYFSELPPEQQALDRNRNRTAVPSLDVSSASRGVYDPHPESARTLSILGVVATLVLLIVCANVANLLLSRAATRRREISLRLCVGATRGRLVRQLLTESVLLATIGGALAIAVTYWSRRLLPFSGEAPPLDWRVFAFAAGISVLTGLVLGVMPALRATQVDLAGSMKENSRSVSRSRTILGKSLLVAQVAISVVLLIGAGLFLRTLQNLRDVDVGFDTSNLLLVSVNPKVNQYDDQHTKRLFSELREAFEAVPGVRSVSLSANALLAGSTWTNSIFIQDGPSDEATDNTHTMTVSPEFFETIGIPILLGRKFTSHDSVGAPRVALINDAAAREYFPEGGPLGRRFGFTPENRASVEIVGVIGDTKYSNIRSAAPPTVYFPYLQDEDTYGMTFELRTAVDPLSVVPAVREAARGVDPNLPLGEFSTQDEQVEWRFSRERTFAQAYTLFGALAVLLASIGLFGLMSYSVAQRTNEIGIRMALGARRRDVVRMVLGESLSLVLIGVAVGLAGAFAARPLVSNLLFDLAPTDPLVWALATLLMIVVATLASSLPARRASRVDPMVSLRHE